MSVACVRLAGVGEHAFHARVVVQHIRVAFESAGAHDDALVRLVAFAVGVDDAQNGLRLRILDKRLHGRRGAVGHGVGMALHGVQEELEHVLRAVAIGLELDAAIGVVVGEFRPLAKFDVVGRAHLQPFLLGSQIVEPCEVVGEFFGEGTLDVVGRAVSNHRVQVGHECVRVFAVEHAACTERAVAVRRRLLLHQQARCPVAFDSHRDGRRKSGDPCAAHDDVELFVPAFRCACLPFGGLLPVRGTARVAPLPLRQRARRRPQ